MSCSIKFKDLDLHLSNLGFARLSDYGFQIAEQTAKPEEQGFVKRMKQLRQEEWCGRGWNIAVDFPSIEERKFWSRVFFDTSRIIFERKVGGDDQRHIYWQAAAIYVAFSAGVLFQRAVQADERGWEPSTIDKREANKVRNGIESQHAA
jgi:hypothetical protein